MTDQAVMGIVAPTRETIEKLQSVMSLMPQATVDTRHYFADGMYCREMFAPEGMAVVGKVHKREHFFMVTQGTVRVWTEAGMQTVSAPFVWVSKPGTKRAILSLTDATYLNVHRTELTDLDAIERELLETDEKALFDARNEVIPERVERIAWPG